MFYCCRRVHLTQGEILAECRHDTRPSTCPRSGLGLESGFRSAMAYTYLRTGANQPTFAFETLSVTAT